jgi:predicted transglutaminase-like protease
MPEPLPSGDANLLKFKDIKKGDKVTKPKSLDVTKTSLTLKAETDAQILRKKENINPHYKPLDVTKTSLTLETENHSQDSKKLEDHQDKLTRQSMQEQILHQDRKRTYEKRNSEADAKKVEDLQESFLETNASDPTDVSIAKGQEMMDTIKSLQDKDKKIGSSKRFKFR